MQQQVLLLLGGDLAGENPIHGSFLGRDEFPDGDDGFPDHDFPDDGLHYHVIC